MQITDLRQPEAVQSRGQPGQNDFPLPDLGNGHGFMDAIGRGARTRPASEARPRTEAGAAAKPEARKRRLPEEKTGLCRFSRRKACRAQRTNRTPKRIISRISVSAKRKSRLVNSPP